MTAARRPPVAAVLLLCLLCAEATVSSGAELRAPAALAAGQAATSDGSVNGGDGGAIEGSVALLEVTRTEGGFSRRRLADTVCDNRNKDLYDLMYHSMPSNCSNVLETPKNFVMMKHAAYWWLSTKKPEEGYWSTNNCHKMREEVEFARLQPDEQRCVCWFTKVIVFADQVHLEVSDRLFSSTNSSRYVMGLFSPEMSSGSEQSKLVIAVTAISKVFAVTPLILVLAGMLEVKWMGRRIWTQRGSDQERYQDWDDFVNWPYYIILGAGVILSVSTFVVRLFSLHLVTVHVTFDQSANENRGWFQADLSLVLFLVLLGIYNCYYLYMFYRLAVNGETRRMVALSDAMMKATLAVTVVKGLTAALGAYQYRSYDSWTNRLFFYLQQQEKIRTKTLQMNVNISEADLQPDFPDDPDDTSLPPRRKKSQKQTNPLGQAIGLTTSSDLILDPEKAESTVSRKLRRVGGVLNGITAMEQRQAEWQAVLGVSDEMLIKPPRSRLNNLNHKFLESQMEHDAQSKHGTTLTTHVANITNIGIKEDDLYMMSPAVSLGVLSYYCEGIYAAAKVSSLNEYINTALALMTSIQVAIMALVQGSNMLNCQTPIVDTAQYNVSDCVGVESDRFCAVQCRSVLPWDKVRRDAAITLLYNQTGVDFHQRTQSSQDPDFDPIHLKANLTTPGVMYCNRGRLDGVLPVCTCALPPALDRHTYDTSDCYSGMPIGGKCDVSCKADPTAATPWYCWTNGTHSHFVGDAPNCTATASLAVTHEPATLTHKSRPETVYRLD